MKKYLLFILIKFLVISIYGQTNSGLPEIIPPSPNAQTFLKYGEYPVSHYTGVPDINIPLYTINLKDISIPVSLSYNASGIKVDEEAGRTGLGWTINAGGLISQIIMGRYNDFYANVYFNNPPENKLYDLTNINYFINYVILGYNNPLPFSLTNMEKQVFYGGISSDNIDCGGVENAPDIFNYNFMGYSGKFIFSRTGEIIKEKEDNLVIIPLIDPNITSPKKLYAWKLITPDGTKYKFSQTEQGQTSAANLSQQYYSSFYLTDIETVNGTAIKLTYLKKGQTIGAYNKVQDSSLNQDISIDYSFYETTYLDKITFPGGAVRFEYAFDRLDYKTEPKLTTIYYDENGTNKNKWLFIYEYFQANISNNEIPTLARINSLIQSSVSHYDDSWNKYRLKLRELKQTDNNKTRSYKFSYNESNLPTKLSASVDHWGYFNGANNLSLIPPYIQNVSQQNGIVDLEYHSSSAANSNRSSAEKLNEAFILNEIIYPTGGKTKFIYESNKYDISVVENDPYKMNLMYSTEKITIQEKQGDGWRNAPFHAETLMIPYAGENNQYVFNFKINIEVDHTQFLYSNYQDRFIYVTIENQSSGNQVFSYTLHPEDLPTPSTMNTTNNKFEKLLNNLPISAGTYTIKLSGGLRYYTKSIDVVITRIIYPGEITMYNNSQLGGGLRIKSIESYDNNNIQLSSKIYNYTRNNSSNEKNTSGKLMFYPRYKKSNLSDGSNGLRGGGYSVGYSYVYVTNIDREGNELGYTSYEYINKPDKNLGYSWDSNESYVYLPDPSYKPGVKAIDENPPGIGEYKFAENGTLLKEVIFKKKSNQYEKAKETIYSYGTISNDNQIVWGVAKSRFVTPYGQSCINYYTSEFFDILPPASIAIGYLYPAIRPVWIRLNEKKETSYDGGIIETVTSYEYDTKYRYVTKENKSTSEGKLFSTEYKYPFSITNNVLMDSLVRQNRLVSSIELTQRVDNNVTSQLVNDYKFFPTKPNLPYLSVVKTNTGINKALEARVTYDNYDNFGNPIQITKDDSEKVVYLWSYNGQYPIAEIKNATYADIVGVLGQTLIDRVARASVPSEADMSAINFLRNNTTTLKDIQITTYTYRPLVGMLTSTNTFGVITYYDYDSFGRLKETYIYKDNIVSPTNKQVIQQYNYNYSTQ